MKKFFTAVLEWKMAACIMFTGSTIVYMIVAFFMGQQSISLLAMLSLLVISALGTFLQMLAFTDKIIKKMRYSLRMLVFAVPFLAVLTGCALIFEWFPAHIMSSWLLFAGIFILVFVVLSIVFEVYFKLTGKKYDGLLGQYRAAKEEAGKK